jgi:hypothetical protein
MSQHVSVSSAPDAAAKLGINGSASKEDVATDGCKFDQVVNDGVEFFMMRHGYPCQIQKGHGQNSQRKTDMMMFTPNPVMEFAHTESSGNSITRLIRRKLLELRTS